MDEELEIEIETRKFKAWVMAEQKKRTCETCGDLDCRYPPCRKGDGE